MKDVLKLFGIMTLAFIGYVICYALVGWLISMALAWPFLRCLCGVIGVHLLSTLIGYTVKGKLQ